MLYAICSIPYTTVHLIIYMYDVVVCVGGVGETEIGDDLLCMCVSFVHIYLYERAKSSYYKTLCKASF